MDLYEMLDEKEICLLGSLPSAVFKYISSADNDISILEIQSFFEYLFNFVEYYKESIFTESINEFNRIRKEKSLDYLCQNFDKNAEKYFEEIKLIIDNKLDDYQKSVYIYFIKNASEEIACSSKEYYGSGKKISTIEKYYMDMMFKVFKIES
jgi:uncharacterized protein YeeX (DUF496 family)